MAAGGRKNYLCSLTSQPFITGLRLRLAYNLNQSWLQVIGQSVCVCVTNFGSHEREAKWLAVLFICDYSSVVGDGVATAVAHVHGWLEHTQTSPSRLL